jgi:hypothetical protein
MHRIRAIRGFQPWVAGRRHPRRRLSELASLRSTTRLGAIDWELSQESKSIASIAKSSNGRSTSRLLAAHLNPRVLATHFVSRSPRNRPGIHSSSAPIAITAMPRVPHSAQARLSPGARLPAA